MKNEQKPKKKKLFEFPEQVYTWADFSDEVASFFIFKGIIILLTLIVVILACIYIGNNIATMCIIIGTWVLYVCFVLYNYYIFAYDKFLLIEGECVSINKPESKVLGNKFYGHSTISLTFGKNIFTVDIPNNASYEEGDIINVYAMPNNIYEKEGNVYVITNPIVIALKERAMAMHADNEEMSEDEISTKEKE